VSLSLIMTLFTEESDRAKAMGVYGFVCAGGGSIGVLLGGVLTTINWHWIFLVNLPIGVLVYVLCKMLIPQGRGLAGTKLDVTGAVTITVSLMLAVYAIVNGNEAGWTSPQTLWLLGAAVAFLVVFLIVESRVSAPLVPLGLFRLRNLAVSNIVGVLWAAGMFAWFFISALYMQLVLGYDPMQVGLAFMPANIIMMAFSLGLSAKIVAWFGIRGPMAVGLILAAVGLGLFAFAPEQGSVWLYVMPGMVLLGIGEGVAFNPVLLAAMGDVKPSDSGLASGIVNTAFMMGGALGLAILASVAAARTASLTAAGESAVIALNGGYHLAFSLGAVCAAVAGVLGGLFIRPSRQPAASVERAGSVPEGA
jgi:MFS family permease